MSTWDGLRCPRCGAGTLVDPADFRYCSYVSCAWGIEDEERAEPGHQYADARPSSPSVEDT